MLKIPRKKNGKKRRDERVEQGITERKYWDCSRNGKEKAEKKEIRQDKKKQRREDAQKKK